MYIIGFEFPKIFSKPEQSPEDDKEREKMKKQEQAPEAPERTIADIQRELDEAERRSEHQASRIRDRHPSATSQHMRVAAAQRVSELRKELEERHQQTSGKGPHEGGGL